MQQASEVLVVVVVVVDGHGGGATTREMAKIEFKSKNKQLLQARSAWPPAKLPKTTTKEKNNSLRSVWLELSGPRQEQKQ